jgi:hypothetical protein
VLRVKSYGLCDEPYSKLLAVPMPHRFAERELRRVGLAEQNRAGGAHARDQLRPSPARIAAA